MTYESLYDPPGAGAFANLWAAGRDVRERLDAEIEENLRALGF